MESSVMEKRGGQHALAPHFHASTKCSFVPAPPDAMTGMVNSRQRRSQKRVVDPCFRNRSASMLVKDSGAQL